MALSSEPTLERASAIRRLLAQPLLLRTADEDVFRTVATQRAFLVEWFEDNLGWRLQVDVRSGVARLHKRTGQPDPHRGLQRLRSTQRPFDRLRYQLLALVCAQLVSRPVTTLGELADAIARISTSDEALESLDPSVHAHRLAFVDVLLWLVHVGALEVRAGEIEGYAGPEDADAVLGADPSLLAQLLSSDVAPSRVEATTTEGWIEALVAEPRYGSAATAPEETDRDQRARWARHQAIRALLDDPAVDLDALPRVIRDYLATPAGRDKVLAAAQTAGMTVERHSDVWLALDPTGESSVNAFGSSGRASTAQQAAALLLGALVPVADDGTRALVGKSRDALTAVLKQAMAKHRGWAKSHRKAGVDALLDQALALLEEFGLARVVADFVQPRPAAARFRLSLDDSTRDKDDDR